MILSKTKPKLKQMNALSRAHHWGSNIQIAKRAILEAAAAYPLSDIQWHNLVKRFGSLDMDKIRELVEQKVLS